MLGGDQRLYPEGFHHIDKLGLMAGGGLDINITRHFALRPISADFLTMSNRVDFEHLGLQANPGYLHCRKTTKRGSPGKIS